MEIGPFFIGLLALLGVTAIAGIIVGQLRRGVITELRHALETAKTEADIERARADRFEARLRVLEIEIEELRRR